MPITLRVETPYNIFEDVHIWAKNILDGKMPNATLRTSELLKWTRPQSHQWIATVMDQAI